jgi:hypothetical protein
MSRKPNTFGGGARTNVNGLSFEQTTSLDDALKDAGYRVEEYEVYNKNDKIGLSVGKINFYNFFLKENGIDYSAFNSKQWRPDECFVNFKNRTVYIIEKKFQHCSGSVDEKLPNCDFKKKEYEKLCHPIDFKVEYLYIFNDWFTRPEYRDTLQYIKDVGCHYFYNKVPLGFLGLQEPTIYKL